MGVSVRLAAPHDDEEAVQRQLWRLPRTHRPRIRRIGSGDPIPRWRRTAPLRPPAPPATTRLPWEQHRHARMPAPARVSLNLEGAPVGSRRPEEGRAALAKERELPAAPRTRSRWT